MAAFTVTWAILGIYLAVLVGILVQSQVRQCRIKSSGSSVEAHYLAGREIPAAFLALTTVASVFSGYTVTGLPAEAYSTGFGYMRWVGLNVPLVVFLVALAPRMVWLAKRRGHVSVLDVVRDRFVTGPVFPCRGCDVQGSVLHWLATLTFFIPSTIYLLAQFISFTANMYVLSDGAVPRWAWGLLFFLLLATFEIVGGLRAVVLTDVFQGGILLFGAVAWLFVQYALFGGVEAASAVLERDSPSLLAPPSGTGFGSWFNFMLLVGAGRIVFPDVLTRFTAASDQSRVRVTAVAITVAAFVVFPAMGLIGIHGRARYGDGVSPNAVFGEVCLEIIESGWFGAIVGSLLLASSQAAIMSTADSVLMEVGKLMSIDICQPVMRACGKDADERTMLWLGRAMTFLMGGLCWVLTAWETVTNESLSNLLALQNIFCTALAPMFFVSMYSDSCPAWLASSSITFGLVFGVLSWALKTNPETLVGDPQPELPAVVFVLNFALVAVSLALLRWRSSADCLWDAWSTAMRARDARRPESARGEAASLEPLPRPSLGLPDPSAPAREPIHHWQVLLAVMAALPLLLPFGGADGNLRTWGLPDWALAFTLRMVGLALVLLYLVAFHWAEAPSRVGKAEREASLSLADSPVHAAPAEA